MNVSFFNFSSEIAGNFWDRGIFIRRWWRLGAQDPRWVPPYAPSFRQGIGAGIQGLLPHSNLTLTTILAMSRQSSKVSSQNPSLLPQELSGAPFGEQAVAAAITRMDSRGPLRIAFLVYPHLVNQINCLEQLLETLADSLEEAGARNLIAPTGLSPYLESGLLVDSWDRLPPLHTPYHPPFMAELFERLMEPIGEQRLFWLPTSSGEPPEADTQIEVLPVQPARLLADLGPLFWACLPAVEGVPPAHSSEIHFLLKWVAALPVEVFAALYEGQPAGFVLLQPDLARLVSSVNGGRSLMQRSWLRWMKDRPVKQGRVVFGGVLPQLRGRGIGRRLAQLCWQYAIRRGWEQLVIGPLSEVSPAARFLSKLGAKPVQRYRLYQWRR